MPTGIFGFRLAGRLEHGVVNFFRLSSLPPVHVARTASFVPDLPSPRGSSWIGARALISSRTHHDKSVHRFDGPPACLQTAQGKPVEQIPGFRWFPCANVRKSLGVRTSPCSEMSLPDPVHHHARKQGIFRARQSIRPEPSGDTVVVGVQRWFRHIASARAQIRKSGMLLRHQ